MNYSKTLVLLVMLLVSCNLASAGAPVSLQSRINAASPGDTINVIGNPLAAEAVIVNKSVTIVGGGTAQMPSGALNALTITVSDVTISGIKIDGNGGGVGIRWDGVDNIAITGCEIFYKETGILATNSDGNTLSGNKLHHNGIIITDATGLHLTNVTGTNASNGNYSLNDIGVFLQNCTAILLENNTIKNNTFEGVRIVNGSGNTVSGGEIGGNNQPANAPGGVYVYNSSDNTIKNAYLHDNKNHAIYVSLSEDTSIEDNNIDSNCGGIAGVALYNSGNSDISGNNVTHGTGNGITIQYSPDCDILDNNISLNTYTGIGISHSCNRTQVERNIINGNGGEGVRAYDSDDNVFTLNTINNNTLEGIYLDISSGNTVSSNEICGNNRTGVYVDRNEDCDIIGNNISYNGLDGVYITAEEPISGHTVTGNTITGNGVVSGGGVAVIGEDDILIQDNLITDHWSTGIDISRGSFDVDVISNDLLNNTVGVRAYHSRDILITSNTITGARTGVLLMVVNDSEVTDNEVSGIFGFGIALDNMDLVSSRNLVDGNHIFSFGTGAIAGIRVMDDNCTISNNVVDCGDPNGTVTGMTVGMGFAIVIPPLEPLGVTPALDPFSMFDGNVFSGNDVSGCYTALRAMSVNTLTLSGEDYYGNIIGADLDFVGNPLTSVIVEDSQMHGNCRGLVTMEPSVLRITNTDFDSNADYPFCPEFMSPLGLACFGAHVDLFNGDFTDNEGYGLLDELPTSVHWTLTEDVVCTNNELLINGWMVPLGGSITATNCNITVLDREIDTDNGQQGYIEFGMNTSSGNDTEGKYNETGVDIELHTDSGFIGIIDVKFYNENPGGATAMTPFGKWINVTPDGSPDLGWYIIRVYYTDGELAESGLLETSLRLWYYNETSGQWEAFNPPIGGVDTVNNYVWANITHFSVFGLYGTYPPVIEEDDDDDSGGAVTGYIFAASAQPPAPPAPPAQPAPPSGDGTGNVITGGANETPEQPPTGGAVTGGQAGAGGSETTIKPATKPSGIEWWMIIIIIALALILLLLAATKRKKKKGHTIAKHHK